MMVRFRLPRAVRSAVICICLVSLGPACRHASAETVVEAWRGGGFHEPASVSVNPADGSCWVADTENNQVVHLSVSGEELWRSAGGWTWPRSVSVNPTDGSCWMADSYRDEVVRLSVNGAELSRNGGFYQPQSVSVNPTDGSCWVADWQHGQVVHLSAGGAELWRGGGFNFPLSVSANPTDGSCWVADSYNNQVVHLSADGTELWRGGEFYLPRSVSADPMDGSCWVAAALNNQSFEGRVAHLSAGGAELWRGSGFQYPYSVSVSPADGSCWVADFYNNEVVHLAADGAERWRGGGFYLPKSVSADPTDGSCWVADTLNSQVAHLVVLPAVTPTAAFTATPASGPAPLTVAFIDLSTNTPTSWAWDFGDGGSATEQSPTHVYEKAGMYTVSLTASNEAGWDTKTEGHCITVTFMDVALDSWALPSILACVDADIVKGYPDGTYKPSSPVTRDQMAVYISRALVTPSGDAAIPDPEPPPTFSDVLSTHWAYKHIEYAVAKNVVKGYDDGTYKPHLVVDRGQMAVFVARAMVTPSGDAGIPDPVPPATFLDVPESFWAYKQVEYCVGQGVVKGYDDGTYRPGDPVTRDQMAVYVARAFELPL